MPSRGDNGVYGLCYEKLRLEFEGDKLYTIIGERTDTSQSSGWTLIVTERGSRFLVDQRCDKLKTASCSKPL